ncbi:MAG: hypothetical protein HXY50_12045 [Ignavibacteriaceae bacterium]|nr:hypothetical protein [Ignavibacteriaceae bacterium]
MKKLLSIAVLFTMFFTGCSNDVNISGPVEEQINKEEFISRTNLEGLSVNTTFTASKTIVGSSGGFIKIGNLATARSGQIGGDAAAITFPAGAFSGSKTITMTIDNVALTGTFSPSMTFTKPVCFNVLFTGVNLSNLPLDQLVFVYYDANNVKYEIASKFIYYDKAKGVLGIRDAQLPHFSRYGFLRKDGI